MRIKLCFGFYNARPTCPLCSVQPCLYLIWTLSFTNSLSYHLLPPWRNPWKALTGKILPVETFASMWKKETTGPKTLKTEAFVNAWTHKMWHGDSAAMIFSIRFVLREFMWHLEKENISGLSLHIVSERGQLPDWGGARGWRHVLCRWHPVHSCHLPPDSTSAVPPCFPGLVPSTKLLVCFSP